MKLFAFQHRDEGERIANAAVVLWKLDEIYDGLSVMRACGIAVMLPIPIYGKFWDVELGALMRGWRLPRVMARFGQSRSGKRFFAFHRWMKPIGTPELLAYSWQIEDGLYPPKEGAN